MMRMEEVTIIAIVLSFLVWVLECVPVEGRTLDPIYWNSSNTMFKSNGPRSIDVAIYDKLDIICPRRGRDDGEELFYFKLYLVSEEHFLKCNITGGRRLITCDVPQREKKYTFYFQQLSPSPWGLEFDPDKTYYVVSTSDGSKQGLDGSNGGVCDTHNMKLKLRVHEAITDKPDAGRPKPITDETVVRPPTHKPIYKPSESVHSPKSTTEKIIPASDNTPSEETVSSNGLIIGIALGAFAVLFIVLIAFLGYKVYRRRRHTKKYQSPPMTPVRGTTPMQQVTLLPISPASHHAHHQHHTRLHSESDRLRSGTITSHSDMRPPPSYNESFLDNGGPVVAV